MSTMAYGKKTGELSSHTDHIMPPPFYEVARTASHAELWDFPASRARS
jgi:hypothetical protein